MCDAGPEMTFHFGQLIAHICKTRNVRAGSIVGSGANRATRAWSRRLAWNGLGLQLHRRKSAQSRPSGRQSTGPFMKFGDTIRIEMKEQGRPDRVWRHRPERLPRRPAPALSACTARRARAKPRPRSGLPNRSEKHRPLLAGLSGISGSRGGSTNANAMVSRQAILPVGQRQHQASAASAPSTSPTRRYAPVLEQRAQVQEIWWSKKSKSTQGKLSRAAA